MFGYFYTCIRYTCVYCTSIFFCIGINKASIVFRGIETDIKLDIRQFLISVLVIGSMIIDVKKTTNNIPDKKRRKLYMHQIRIHSNCIKSMHHKEIRKLKIASWRLQLRNREFELTNPHSLGNKCLHV